MGKPKIKKDAVAALAKVRKVFPYKLIRDSLDPDDPEVDRDLDMFQIFMAIRVLHKDGSNTAYALCPRLKRIWSAFLHRPLAYHQFCNRALNQIIDYDPKSPATEEARSEYNDNTIHAFQETFHVPYIPDPGLLKTSTDKHIDDLFERVPHEEEEKMEEEPITLDCQDADGSNFTLFNISPATSVGNVKEAISQHRNVAVASLVLVYKGTLLANNKSTLRDYGMMKNCSLDINPFDLQLSSSKE